MFLTMAAMLGLFQPSEDVFLPPAEPPVFVVHVLEDGFRASAWEEVPTYDAFVVKDPDQGASPQRRTTVQIAADSRHLHLRFRMESDGRVRVQNLLRDFSEYQNDFVGFALDGFLDQRNASVFMVTPYGSKRDLQVRDGDILNEEWNEVWEVEVFRSDTSWTAHFAIPWRALRYPDGATSFGILLFRGDRARNEIHTMPAMPRSVPLHRIAYAGRLVGIRPPPASMSVQARPYVLAEQRDGIRPPRTGVDLKWLASSTTVVDLTVNTDFAQTEIDRLVLNFDRYPVLLPERRSFFLENATLFNASVTSFILPFFSRRVGLDPIGRPVPIRSGFRVTHADARNSGGLMVIDQEGARIGVGRYSRAFGDENRVGLLATYRDGAEPTNASLTMDMQARVGANILIRGMASGSSDAALGEGLATQSWFSYRSNALYAGMLTYTVNNYNPGLGVERFGRDYIMLSPAFNFDLDRHPFPDWVRRYRPGIYMFSFLEPGFADNINTYVGVTPVDLLLESGGAIVMSWIPTWQHLDVPFRPLGIQVDAGRYRYDRFRASASSDPSSPASLYGSWEGGTYYDGRLMNLSAGMRLAPSHRLQWTAEATRSRIRGLGPARSDLTTLLVDTGVRYAWNPDWLASAFGQWESRSERVVWSGRLSWEYRPLSFIHLVYNGNRFADVTEHQAIFKIALLHAF
jgi:hypothetical protein